MSKYQVVYLVKAIVGVDVNADSGDEAIEIATKKLNTKEFRIINPKFEYLDGSYKLCGYDDLDAWSEVDD